jgi:hypothetical protein
MIEILLAVTLHQTSVEPENASNHHAGTAAICPIGERDTHKNIEPVRSWRS